MNRSRAPIAFADSTRNGIHRLAAAFALLATLGHAHVTLVNPEGREDIAGGSTFTIAWDADPHNCVYNLYFSPDGGNTWSVIMLGIDQDVRTYKWAVPDTETQAGIVRILQDNVSGSDLDDRSAPFRIHTGTALRGKGGKAGGTMLELHSHRLETALMLEQEADIAIDAYSTEGRFVAALARTRLPAGAHRLQSPLGNLPDARTLLFRVMIGGEVACFSSPLPR